MKSLRKSLSWIFYAMSPFFPGNNSIEIFIMLFIAKQFHYLNFFTNIDKGNLASINYLIYNVIGIVGFLLLKEGKLPDFKNLLTWIELIGSFAYLYLSKFIPSPYDYIISILIIIYFSRKTIYNFLRKHAKVTES